MLEALEDHSRMLDTITIILLDTGFDPIEYTEVVGVDRRRN
jgi:hypothetical protein